MSRRFPLFLALLLAGVAAAPAFALQSGVSTQVRQFDNHKEFADRPFAHGDYGYGLAYEIRDVKGSWQLGALYTPDAGEDDAYDYAVTPFINMFFRDRIFIGGMGANITYLPKTDTEDEEWGDVYWNFLMGLEFPLGKHLALSGLALYDFENWDDLNKFDFDDVEFAVALTLLF
ncbi:MAG: hypothetical protein R6X19_05720 [Kiritimatiellia bacterium]